MKHLIFNFPLEQSLLNITNSKNNSITKENLNTYLNDSSNNDNQISPPIFKKITDDHYQLADIFIDMKKKEISFPAEFILEDGPIELLLTSRGGKEHESVLTTSVVASQLQTALLFIGAEPGLDRNQNESGKLPVGDSLLVYVDWIDSSKNSKRVKATDLIFDNLSKKAMKNDIWIFKGSYFLEKAFMGDSEKTLISTYNFRSSVIDNPSMGGRDDCNYTVNTGSVPKKGTNAKVIIKLNK